MARDQKKTLNQSRAKTYHSQFYQRRRMMISANCNPGDDGGRVHLGISSSHPLLRGVCRRAILSNRKPNPSPGIAWVTNTSPPPTASGGVVPRPRLGCTKPKRSRGRWGRAARRGLGYPPVPHHEGNPGNLVLSRRPAHCLHPVTLGSDCSSPSKDQIETLGSASQRKKFVSIPTMTTPNGTSAPKVAIIGAGLTGLLAAHGLKKVCL